MANVNMVFAYYDTSISVSIHRANEDRDPLCGASASLDNGEFLYSDQEYDRKIVEETYDMNFDKITCKRCLKKLKEV